MMKGQRSLKSLPRAAGGRRRGDGEQSLEGDAAAEQGILAAGSPSVATSPFVDSSWVCFGRHWGWSLVGYSQTQTSLRGAKWR